MSDLALRGLSAGGLFVLLGVAWIASSNRAAVDRRMVRNGMALQLVLAGVLLGTRVGKVFFVVVESFGGLFGRKKAAVPVNVPTVDGMPAVAGDGLHAGQVVAPH